MNGPLMMKVVYSSHKTIIVMYIVIIQRDLFIVSVIPYMQTIRLVKKVSLYLNYFEGLVSLSML